MAKRKEVLLVKDVLKLGNMGDLVRVAPGYARNFLFPFGVAIPAGEAAKRQIEVLREKAAKSEVEREAKANTLRKSMQGMSIQIAARVAHDDELFGSIGTKEIVAALAKSGIEVDGKQIHLHDKLRKLGRYSIDIRLHKNVAVTVTLEVVNSDPNAPSLDETLAAVAAAREAQKAAKKNKDEASGDTPADAKTGDAPRSAEAAKSDPVKSDKAKTEKPKSDKSRSDGDAASAGKPSDAAKKSQKA